MLSHGGQNYTAEWAEWAEWGKITPFSAYSAYSAYSASSASARQRVIVTTADALLVGSAADVALTVTVAGDGTRRGAV